jgi:hypothetical protein
MICTVDTPYTNNGKSRNQSGPSSLQNLKSMLSSCTLNTLMFSFGEHLKVYKVISDEIFYQNLKKKRELLRNKIFRCFFQQVW